MSSEETVEYAIIIKAAVALESLQQLASKTSDFTERINLASLAAKKFAADNNIAMSKAVSVLKNVDSAMAKVEDTTSVLGEHGPKAWSALTAAVGATVPKAEDAADAQKKVGDAAEKVGDSAEKGSRKAVRSIDAMRIALGVLVSMLIFQVIQAFQNAMRMAIDNIKETELAVYNLINAERRLSEQGIDVTPKGLQETIDGLQKLVPILSRIQAEELVSRIATNVAPALKFTDQQIQQLSESVALLYVRNKALGYSFDEIEKAITDAFLTGKVSQGINKFGVSLSDQIVKDEALRMGLVRSAEEFDNLSGEMEKQVKAAAMLSVVYQNASQDLDNLGEYMNTFDAQSERASSAWSNFLTMLGSAFSPALKESLKLIADRLELINGKLDTTGNLASMVGAIFAGMARSFGVLANSSFFDRLLHPLETFQEMLLAFGSGVMDAQNSLNGLADAADTPTAAIEGLNEAMDNFDADGFRRKIEDILQDAANAQEDLDTKLSRKMEDLDEKYVQKAEDARRDLARKIEDINLDAERKREDALRKAREDDIKAEQQYQLKLWELRMRYLMDLEDALHARDARQIIRLQKQYNIDKEALERKKAIEDQNREDSLEADLEQIELQRQRRIEDAQIEYQQKLADQQEAKQRELEDLALWYAREQADLQEHTRRKLEDLIRAWVQEGKITQQGAQQVYDILRTYFGPGGMTDALYAYMQSQLANAFAFPSLGGAPTIPTPSMGGSAGTSSGGIGGRSSNVGTRTPSSTAFAEGGTLIATRPMTATFGEVPEAVTFTPLSGRGNNEGKLFGDKSGLGGMMEILLTLSPDLESRIVKKSLNGVADVMVKVNRSKV